MVLSPYEELRAMSINLRGADYLGIAQEIGFIGYQKQAMELLAKVEKGQRTKALKEATNVFSNLAFMSTFIPDYETAKELKVRELVGLEILISSIDTEKHPKDRRLWFNANDIAGNSYATFANWQHRALKENDDVSMLMAYVRFNNCLKAACGDRSLKFKAQSQEFINYIINRRFLQMAESYRSWDAGVLTMFEQAKDVCEAVEMLPYEACANTIAELRNISLSDLRFARDMLTRGIIELPPNIELDRSKIKAGFEGPPKRSPNYTIHETADTTIFERQKP